MANGTFRSLGTEPRTNVIKRMRGGDARPGFAKESENVAGENAARVKRDLRCPCARREGTGRGRDLRVRNAEPDDVRVERSGPQSCCSGVNRAGEGACTRERLAVAADDFGHVVPGGA